MLWVPPNPKKDSVILARFAIDEHNKNEDALLEFSRVVGMKDELADGVLHHLMVEVIDAGNDKLYEAKVWRKPWMGIVELQEFEQVDDDSATITADEYGPGWRVVPVDDPEVKDAANTAMRFLQSLTSTMYPYELMEILHPRAEVVGEETANISMVINVRCGIDCDKYRLAMHKYLNGAFYVYWMEWPHRH